MIPRIKKVLPLDNLLLDVEFTDGKRVIYDVKEDLKDIPSYKDLLTINGLFQQVKLDESRTCVYWNDYIDFPSDCIYEYGRGLVND